MKKIYNLVQSFFSLFNLKISRIASNRKNFFEAILSIRNNLNKHKLNDFELSFYNHLLENFKNSKSEKFQDLFADWVMSSKKGFFIEFGCCDGLYLSNTFFWRCTEIGKES